MESFGKTFCRLVAGKKIESELDWLLSSQQDMIENKKLFQSGLSDHAAIMWEMRTVGKKELPHRYKKARKYGKKKSTHHEERWERNHLREERSPQSTLPQTAMKMEIPTNAVKTEPPSSTPKPMSAAAEEKRARKLARRAARRAMAEQEGES